MKLSVFQVYTSVACNRTPEIVDWNNEGVLCFGAKNAVVIYDRNIKNKDPIKVFTHHRSQVNSVKWLHKPDGSCNELISCSADRTAAIWTLNQGIWKVTASLVGHGDGVTSVHGVYNEEALYVFTGSIDCTIRVWERVNGVTILKQTISLHNGLCLTLHSHILPTVNQPVLFAALDDHKVHVFAGDEYNRVHTLVGHEDWVRGLDVLVIDESTILLASASQDTYIRIWKIQIHCKQTSNAIRVEEKVFSAYGQQWSVKLDAVLAGHEGWVYGVQWQPRLPGEEPTYRLLSSSLDKTLVIWEPESEGGVWTERARLGEAGGGGLGFYGGRLLGSGDAVLGHGYNGSLHLWNRDKKTGRWERGVVLGGHFSSVEDVRWEPRGRYLLSTSADQTTRIHAPWRRHGVETWHEISRPQVHGYDLCALAPISPTIYAAAAEEKVIRVFQATHNFTQNFANITGEKIELCGDGGPEGAMVPSLGLSNKAVFADDDDDQEADEENDGYFVPVNLTEPPTEEVLMQNTLWAEAHKLYGHGHEVRGLAAAPRARLLASAARASAADHAHVILCQLNNSQLDLAFPPSRSVLRAFFNQQMDIQLDWAFSPPARYKSVFKQQRDIQLDWAFPHPARETQTWQQIQKLPSHQLTVTQMEFSPNSQQLLTVSRDRTWSLFTKREESNLFDLTAKTDKKNGVHTRIIWCCSWAHDGEMFATGSRDGKVCVWTKTDTTSDTSLKNYNQHGDTLLLKDSVMSLAFAPVLNNGARIIVCGLESGIIKFYSFDGKWTELSEIDNDMGHHLSVKRLAFKPPSPLDDHLLLASCGADNLVRLHSIAIV